MSITTLVRPQPPVSDRCETVLSHLVLSCGWGDESALAALFDHAYFMVAATLRDCAVPTYGADDEVVAAFKRIWHRSPSYVPQEQGALSWLRDQVVDGRTPAHPDTSIRAAS